MLCDQCAGSKLAFGSRKTGMAGVWLCSYQFLICFGPSATTCCAADLQHFPASYIQHSPACHLVLSIPLQRLPQPMVLSLKLLDARTKLLAAWAVVVGRFDLMFGDSGHGSGVMKMRLNIASMFRSASLLHSDCILFAVAFKDVST